MSQTHLYRHFDKDGVLLYVGISLSAFKRFTQHQSNADWASSIKKMTIETFPSRVLALRAEANAISNEKPLHNIAGKPKCATFITSEVAPKAIDNRGERRNKKLTKKEINSIKRKIVLGEKVPSMIHDGNGLYLRTRNTGGMSFVVRRWGFPMITLGRVAIGLAAARKLAAHVLALQAIGIDPSQAKREFPLSMKKSDLQQSYTETATEAA